MSSKNKIDFKVIVKKIFSSNIFFGFIIFMLFLFGSIMALYEESSVISYLKTHKYDTLIPYFVCAKFCTYVGVAIAFLNVLHVLITAFSKKTINKAEKEKLKEHIDILCTVLLKIFRIESQSRVSVFISKGDDSMLSIFHRKEGGKRKSNFNNKLYFIDDEGLPGKAKLDPVILDDSASVDKLIEKLHIHHMPPEHIRTQDKENIKNYYKEVFNIDHEKFSLLGERKYKILSYISIGFMSGDLKRVMVISIDSLRENAFQAFESANNLIKQSKSELVTVMDRNKRSIDIGKEKAILTDEMERIFSSQRFELDPRLIYYYLLKTADVMYKLIYGGEIDEEYE